MNGDRIFMGALISASAWLQGVEEYMDLVDIKQLKWAVLLQVI